MKITIIGAGNMGGAIARALAVSDISDLEITCTVRSAEKLERLSADGFKATSDNRAAVKSADVVIFAVKPWLMEAVVRDVAPFMDLSNQIVASVAAGVTFGQLYQWLGGSAVMFRIIPNTAIEVGSGVTFISSCNASSAQRSMVLDMFSRMGYALEVEESMMAAGTALASCGIAYAMKYIQASAAGGESLGFSPEKAREIVEYTVKGAAELLLSTGNAPQTEIDKVTTPGGMTQKGLAAMDKDGFSQAVVEGLNACLK
jgi:pyrroline-5-carboxylate reductase